MCVCVCTRMERGSAFVPVVQALAEPEGEAGALRLDLRVVDHVLLNTVSSYVLSVTVTCTPCSCLLNAVCLCALCLSCFTPPNCTPRLVYNRAQSHVWFTISN